jgi:hypothetical protein
MSMISIEKRYAEKECGKKERKKVREEKLIG